MDTLDDFASRRSRSERNNTVLLLSFELNEIKVTLSIHLDFLLCGIDRTKKRLKTSMGGTNEFEET